MMGLSPKCEAEPFVYYTQKGACGSWNPRLLIHLSFPRWFAMPMAFTFSEGTGTSNNNSGLQKKHSSDLRRLSIPGLRPSARSEKLCTQFGSNRQHASKGGIHERTVAKAWTNTQYLLGLFVRQLKGLAPGHTGIEGNEATDKLANLSALKPQWDESLASVPTGSGIQSIARTLRGEARAEWWQRSGATSSSW